MEVAGPGGARLRQHKACLSTGSCRDPSTFMAAAGLFDVTQSIGDQAAATFSKVSLHCGQILAEYIWIGSTGADLHSKTKVLESSPSKVEQLPTWHFDSTHASQPASSSGLTAVVLRPRAIYRDPLRGASHILVLCDTHTPSFNQSGGSLEYAAHPTNNRVWCESVMADSSVHEPAFSVEQQFTLLDTGTRWPLGERFASSLAVVRLPSVCRWLEHNSFWVLHLR